MRILLVRHGDAVGTKGKFHGLVDNPLTAKGRVEAASAADKLAEYKPNMIYTSPLSRTRETARILSSELGNVPIKTSNALKPLDLGDFVGKPIDTNLDKVKQYLSNPSKKIPGGGTVKDWANNYLPFLEQFYKNKSDQTIMFVTHGRNILLSNAYLKAGANAPNFDKSVLLDTDKSTEHGGFAVIDPKSGFSIVTPKSVKAGQS